MTEFLIEREKRPGATYFVVTGELDIATAPRLEAELAEGVAAGRAIVVDLAGVTFMDSSGLRSILAGHGAARSHDVRFSVVAPTPPVQRIFELTRIADEIEILPDRASPA